MAWMASGTSRESYVFPREGSLLPAVANVRRVLSDVDRRTRLAGAAIITSLIAAAAFVEGNASGHAVAGLAFAGLALMAFGAGRNTPPPAQALEPMAARARPLPTFRRTIAHQRSDAAAYMLAERVSHDMRTPLNAVIGFSELMQAELHGPHGDARYREYAQHIRQSGEALKRTAEDAIAMTHLAVGAVHHERHETLAVAALMARMEAEHQVSISANDETAQVTVQIGAFSHAFERLLRSLRNADGTATETPVNISVECDSVAHHVTLVVHTSGSDIPPKPQTRRPAAQSADFPRIDDDLNFCFAKSLFQSQNIECALLENSADCDGADQCAVITMPCCFQAQLPL
ncbi:MAG: histidine kinase dimerization/phospho-acceptor domain-containing protein [Pseudomonadota bacterium]